MLNKLHGNARKNGKIGGGGGWEGRRIWSLNYLIGKRGMMPIVSIRKLFSHLPKLCTIISHFSSPNVLKFKLSIIDTCNEKDLVLYMSREWDNENKSEPSFLRDFCIHFSQRMLSSLKLSALHLSCTQFKDHYHGIRHILFDLHISLDCTDPS